MLGKLFGSNARVKILKLFLLNPEKKYYIRQMSRDLNLQVNSVRRELDNLTKLGLLVIGSAEEEEEAHLVITSDGNGLLSIAAENIMKNKDVEKNEQKSGKQEKKYYQVNTKFLLYDEIRSLIIKSQLLYEQDFIEQIMKLARPKLFVLSGFFVGNNQSTTDMLLVGKFSREKLTGIIKEFEAELGREINYTVMDQQEFEYRRSMTDMFLYAILEGRRMVVVDDIGLGSFS